VANYSDLSPAGLPSGLYADLRHVGVTASLTGAEATAAAGTLAVDFQVIKANYSDLSPVALPLAPYPDWNKVTPTIASVTGAEIGADSGAFTVVGNAIFAITGDQVNVQTDAVVAGGTSIPQPTGVATAAQAGNVTISFGVSATLTGAEAAAEYGTAAGIGEAAKPAYSDLSPLGLPVGPYSSFDHGAGANIEFAITGAQIASDAGTVTLTIGTQAAVTGAETAGEAASVTVGVTAGTGKDTFSDLGPIGLSGVYTVFTGKGIQRTAFSDLGPVGLASLYGAFTGKNTTVVDTAFEITGAQINSGATEMLGSTVVIYIDGAESAAQAGSTTVTGKARFALTGASSSAQSGAVAAADVQTASVTGAEAAAHHGELTIQTNGDAVSLLYGAVIAAQQGSVAFSGGTKIAITGASIIAQSGTVTASGTSTVVDVDVELTGAEIAVNQGTAVYGSFNAGEILRRRNSFNLWLATH